MKKKIQAIVNPDKVIHIDEKYTDKDNYGRPKSIFLKELADDTDEALFEHCKHFIWLSAYASNNPRSDYHWQCDACYDECDHRGKVEEIYSAAHKSVVAANS